MAPLRAFSGMMIYVASGLMALIFASWLSTQFVGRALSQTNPYAGQINTPPHAGQAPPPPAKAANPDGLGGSSANPVAIPSSPSDVQVPGEPSAANAAKPVNNSLADVIEDYTYTPQGKRDPFEPMRVRSSNVQLGPMWPLQRFELDQLKLVGIIWDVKTPKAMILDPSGKGYVVSVNERIGRNNGYIARIREGEVIIVESITGMDGKLSYQTKLMKLQQE